MTTSQKQAPNSLKQRFPDWKDYWKSALGGAGSAAVVSSAVYGLAGLVTAISLYGVFAGVAALPVMLTAAAVSGLGLAGLRDAQKHFAKKGWFKRMFSKPAKFRPRTAMAGFSAATLITTFVGPVTFLEPLREAAQYFNKAEQKFDFTKKVNESFNVVGEKGGKMNQNAPRVLPAQEKPSPAPDTAR